VTFGETFNASGNRPAMAEDNDLHGNGTMHGVPTAVGANPSGGGAGQGGSGGGGLIVIYY
jgi:hypothetical protein